MSRPDSGLEALTAAVGWRAELISLTEANLAQKYQAIAAYASQLSTFFTSYDDLVRQVGGYANQIGGERYWHFQPKSG